MAALTVRSLEVETVGNHLDLAMTSRALTRTFAALGWFALAVAFTSDGAWLWGLPLLLGAAASWRSVTTDAERAAPNTALRERLRPPPARFLDGPRILELSGLVAAAVATGHVVAIFDRPDAARLATVLVLLNAVPTMGNLVAHRSHVRFPGPPAYPIARRLVGVASGPLALALLWPAEATGAAIALVALGAVFLGAASFWTAVQFDRSIDIVQRTVDSAYRAAVKDLFLPLHNDLRNPARGVLNAITLELAAAAELENALESMGEEDHPAVESWRSADDTARQVTIGLARRVSEFVEMTRRGGSSLPRRASDVMDAILQFHNGAPSRHRGAVVRQLDPKSLTTLDNDMIALSLTELVTNAVTAGAKRIEVQVDSDTDEAGRTCVHVVVVCSCGKQLPPGRPGEGTLGLLADRLEAINGPLSVTDDANGAHVTTASWPTDASPLDLATSEGSAHLGNRRLWEVR